MINSQVNLLTQQIKEHYKNYDTETLLDIFLKNIIISDAKLLAKTYNVDLIDVFEEEDLFAVLETHINGYIKDVNL